MTLLNKELDGIGMTSARVRDKMVETLQAEGISNPAVLKAMREVPRHIFVDSAISHHAYENIPLPIGWEQTISQPYTVARITELVLEGLESFQGPVKGSCNKVLEIGGGCGYQSAILSTLFKEVYAVERVGPLYMRALENIKKIGAKNINLAHKDGYEGWEDKAPFDAIIVSAATSEIPKALIGQLAQVSCLILPRGNEILQRLTLVLMDDGEKTVVEHDRVIFVPLLEGLRNASSNDSNDSNNE